MTSASQGPPDSNDEPLADMIARQLRRDILRGTFPPGAPVKERDNAARLGVSRTPLREAIRILASEGLVELRPSRSPIVAEPPFQDIADQVSVLKALEMLSGQQACLRATAQDLAAILALKTQIEQNYDAVDPLDIFELDMQFHTLIVAASHNAALVATHRDYLRRLWRARYLSARRRDTSKNVITQHDAIVKALIARDVPQIQKIIAAHIDDMLLNIHQHFHETDQGNVP